jgi:lactoylglutathione lyase
VQNYTLIRAKDHEKSLAFYKDVMGMKLKVRILSLCTLAVPYSKNHQRVSENAGAKFNLYFFEYG